MYSLFGYSVLPHTCTSLLHNMYKVCLLVILYQQTSIYVRKLICYNKVDIAKSIIAAILMIPLLYLGDNSGYFVSQAKIAKKNSIKLSNNEFVAFIACTGR